MLEFCSTVFFETLSTNAFALWREKKCDKDITHILRWSFSLHTIVSYIFIACTLFLSLSHSFQTNVQYLPPKKIERKTANLLCNSVQMQCGLAYGIVSTFANVFVVVKEKGAKEESIFKCLSSSFEWCSNIGIVYKSNDPSVIFYVHSTHTHTYIFVSMHVYGLDWG